MKKTLALLTLILLTSRLLSQDFSVDMYFEDSKGNRDTIVLGYDPIATAFVDSSFGETNLKNIAIDSVFDVSISDGINKNILKSPWDTVFPATFRLKKNIYNDNNFQSASIEIITQNWPISVEWDASLFTSPNNEGSILTTMPPFCWFDACGGYIYELKKESYAEFTKEQLIDNSSFYFNGQDTVFAIFQAFGGKNLISNTMENQDTLFKMIPVKDSPNTFICSFPPNYDKASLTITTDLGNEIFTHTLTENGEQLINLPNGLKRDVYFCSLAHNGQVLKTIKIIVTD